jgi:hypothetical protein
MGLQRFKESISNTVISADNSSLASMGTDQLLDLFEVCDFLLDRLFFFLLVSALVCAFHPLLNLTEWGALLLLCGGAVLLKPHTHVHAPLRMCTHTCSFLHRVCNTHQRINRLVATRAIVTLLGRLLAPAPSRSRSRTSCSRTTTGGTSHSTSLPSLSTAFVKALRLPLPLPRCSCKAERGAVCTSAAAFFQSWQ